MNHISILHHVLFAFWTHLAGFFCALFTLMRQKIVICNRLLAEKPALKSTVNRAGRLWRGRAARNRPGAHLLDAGGEIGVQSKAFKARPYHAVQARLA